MNALIETLNRWGEAAIPLAGQVLWQTSLLIIVLLALDLWLRHRIRAGFRYALWMLLLVKLILPPSLALPTGAGYWIERPAKVAAPVEPPVAEVAALPPPVAEVNHPADPGIVVEADFFDHLLAEAMADAPPSATAVEVPTSPAPAATTPTVKLTRSGQLLAVWLAGTWLLLGWMLWRWRWVTRLVRASEPAPDDLQALLATVYRENVLPAACRHFPEADRTAEDHATDHERKGDIPVAQSQVEATGVSPFRFFAPPPACPTLRLTDAAMSPAVCGLFRPVILLPRKLVGKLSREQLGTVLLHELIHLRRRDLWVNCVQTLLQIAAWWHPLLWLANARIRRVREEAVDEAVACALRDDADAYPATLLEVAKLTFTRPLMTLGLVGILESKHALKQRIRRLLELPPLESTRLKWWQWVAVAAIALTALPMAEGQRRTPVQPVSDDPTSPTFSSRAGINYNPKTDLAPWENPQAEPVVIGYEYLQDGTWAQTPEPPNSASARFFAQAEPASKAPAADVATPVQRTSDSTAPGEPDDGATPGDQLFMEVQSWVQLNALRLSLTLHNSRLNERLSEVRAIDYPEQLQVAILKTFAEEANATGLTKLHQDEVDLRKRLAALQASDDRDQEAMKAAQESLASLQAASQKVISEIMKGAAVGVQANSNRLVGLTHELEVKQRKLIGSATDVSSLSNLLAAAQAVFKKVQTEHSATLLRMMVNDLWLRDRAVLEHPFVQRHLEALNFTPPAEYLAIHELYQTTRNLRDMISMKLAQEKINEAIGRDQVRVDKAEVRAEFQRQLDSAERDMELAREEYRALQEKLGPDPLTRPEQTLSKEEFLRLMPVIQAGIQLNQSSNRVQSARDRLAEVEARAKDQGSLSPQPDAAKRTSGWLVEQAPEWRQSWGMRQPSPPFKLPHTNLTEYGALMVTSRTLFPDPRVSGYRAIGLEPRFVLVPVEGLSRALGGQLPLARPLIIASNELAALTNSLIEGGAVDHSSAAPTRFSKMSGGVFHWQVAEGELSQVMFQTADNSATNSAASHRQIVFGARHSVPAFAPDWVPLTLLARPFAGDDDSLHSILSLATGEQQPVVLAQAEETIPPGGSLIWASTNEVRAGFAQAVILHNSGPPVEEADESAAGVGDGAAKAAALIWIARELIETGNLDEAERLLREAAVNATTTAEIDQHLDRIRRLKLVENASPDFVQRATQTSPRSSPERRKLLEKLNRITLDRVEFDSVPLVEAVKVLSDESRRRDPEKEGIRFMIAGSIGVTNYEDDPGDSTGQPPPTRPTTRLEIGDPKITINPPMQDLRLIDVLNTIVMSADRPIKFTVEEFAVVFAPRTPEPEHLETRVFRVHPNIFDRMKAAQTNAPIPSGAVTNEMSVVNQVVRHHFKAAGVSLVAPKMLYFNERTGMLMIKATLEDLEIIQRALEKLRLEGEPQTSPPAESGSGAGATDGKPDEATSKVENAKLLMDAGKLDEAEALLREAAVNSTTPTEVYYHLDRIQQMRSAGTQRPESLETRVFRVNPNTFYEGLKVVMTNALPTTPARTNAPAPAPIVQGPGGGGIRFLTTNDMSVVNVAVRDYFEMVGVKFEPPKMIFYNDRTGMLMVKATLADLEIVQRAVEMLNYEPPQVTLEVRTVEVTKDDVRALGFDSFMNPPGQPGGHTNAVTGVLTDPQFRLVVKALEQRANVSVEFFPRTTTLSGHQTQLRRSESTNVVTGVTNTVAGPEYGTEYVAVGTTVTLSPFVLEDGHTIDLLADVRLVQFLGYDDPVARGLPAQVPLPHFNRQSTRQSMKIRSGNTMVLGGMTTQHLVVAKDKVPVLGDIPLLGRLFRHEEKFMETKHVLVFITPTIIAPAGNRVQVPLPIQPDQE